MINIFFEWVLPIFCTTLLIMLVIMLVIAFILIMIDALKGSDKE